MLLKRGKTFFYSQIKIRRFFCDGKNNYINNSYSNYIPVNKNIKNNNNNYEDDNEVNKKNIKSGDIPKDDVKLKTSQHIQYNSNNYYTKKNYVHNYENKYNKDKISVNPNMNQMENNMIPNEINDEYFHDDYYNEENKYGNDDRHKLDYPNIDNNYNNINDGDNIHSMYNDRRSNKKMKDLKKRKENREHTKNVDEQCYKNDDYNNNYVNYNHNKEYNMHNNMSPYNNENIKTKEDYIKDKQKTNNYFDNKNIYNNLQDYSNDNNISNDIPLNDKDNFLNDQSNEHKYENIEKKYIRDNSNVKENNEEIIMNGKLNKQNDEKDNMENPIIDNNKINQDHNNTCSDKNSSSEWIENEEDIPNVFEVDENLTEEEKEEKLKLIKLITEKLASPLKTTSDNKNQNESVKNENDKNKKEEENSLFADDRPIAIEVDGPSHFYANSNRYTTYTKLKHRILTKLGYNVIHISYIDWRKLRNKSEREEFILKKLKEKNDEFLDDEDRTYYNERMNMIKDDYVKYMNDKKASTN
ncbi:RAP protein, putative [Plasmodium reichenowi]|uniref:RAP protein, putative n=1 Tax=Plasmodium reichenowi TaxID=5854 RepID=A0A2P9DRG5_PLARE|nr:RAP protein, putative [Plasmodium reichenowi]